MLSYSEAAGLISEQFQQLNPKTEQVPLTAALGRTLEEDIFSDINLPPFDNSAVDGFGVLFEANRRTWHITAEIAAGNFHDVSCKPGEAIRIMTGARLPQGVTTMIPIEDVQVDGENIHLNEEARYRDNMNIRPKAGDIALDELAVPKGTVLRPRHLATAASCGKETLTVLKPLRFALLATGDELVTVGTKPDNDKIRVSNIYSLAAEIQDLGQTVTDMGFLNDDRTAIEGKVSELLNSDADVVVTTGGVSVGKYDFLKQVFADAGVREVFWRAWIKPGKPIFFGTFERDGHKKLVFGLPGNPVSSQVNFKVFIRPCVQHFFNQPADKRIMAQLEDNLRKKDSKRHFMRARLRREGDRWLVSAGKSQSSGSLVQLGQANCLIEVDEETRNPQKGAMVACIPI